MNLKRCFSFLFCLCFLVSSVSFSALADTRYKATSSDATSSNAFVSDRLDIEPFSTVHSIQNTVNYSSTIGYVVYYDEIAGDGIVHYEPFTINSKGQFKTKSYDLKKYDVIQLLFRMNPGAIPSAGKYRFMFDFASDFSYTGWSTQCQLLSHFHYKNAGSVLPSYPISATEISGDYGFACNIDLPSYNSSSDDYIQVLVPVTWSSGDAAYRPESIQWGGAVFFNFSRLGSNAEVQFDYNQYGSTENDYNSQMAQSSQQIADNTAQIVQGQNQVIEEIQALVQHISDQLFALWQQIYSGIWQPHERLMNRIIDAIDNVHIDITENASNVAQQINKATNDITKSVTDNTSSIIKNNNDNTTSINNKLEDTKQGIVSGILEGLKSLFIPSNEYFKAWFDDIYAFFSDRLGFLMLPIDLLIRLLNIFLSGNVQFAGIPFPELSWNGTIIIPAQQVGFEFLNTEWGKELQNMLYFATDVILIGALLKLMHRKLEEVLRG